MPKYKIQIPLPDGSFDIEETEALNREEALFPYSILGQRVKIISAEGETKDSLKRSMLLSNPPPKIDPNMTSICKDDSLPNPHTINDCAISQKPLENAPEIIFKHGDLDFKYIDGNIYALEWVPLDEPFRLEPNGAIDSKYSLDSIAILVQRWVPIKKQNEIDNA